MSWLNFCGLNCKTNGVSTPTGFSKQFSPMFSNFDIFTQKSKREERYNEEIRVLDMYQHDNQ